VGNRSSGEDSYLTASSEVQNILQIPDKGEFAHVVYATQTSFRGALCLHLVYDSSWRFCIEGANQSDSRDEKYSGRIAWTPKSQDEYVFSYINQKGEKGVPLYAGPNLNATFSSSSYRRWPYWNKDSYYSVHWLVDVRHKIPGVAANKQKQKITAEARRRGGKRGENEGVSKEISCPSWRGSVLQLVQCLLTNELINMSRNLTRIGER